MALLTVLWLFKIHFVLSFVADNMPEIDSVHDALCQGEWSVEQIQLILQNSPSSVNEIQSMQSPLHRVLTDRRCSIAIVKVLLFYGADPNFKIYPGSPTPLILALYCRDRIDIIRTLVEGGT